MAAKVACDYPPYHLNKLISTKFANSGSPAVTLIKNFHWTNADQNLVADLHRQGRHEAGRRGAEVDRRQPEPGQPVAPGHVIT